ncbi:uncharacterized protein ASCRUDRAFT_80743 [Ascoidea rubescens DSM 1968]|uniref:Uncharacterized protein n=1 Tax=Ascoidea rubescens DSM 1968 TaxID=1344418 RepID=A0A1D2VH04_9ASCO|nr:hypothetical protein ASCRUDRAFT_80743 [Ascoidea rubescens DSM 1968]ODV60934.1 hypothetical protein ASCRUDRAFT_80743 [Ascoidea rubescens DSM 1968]
MQLFGSNKFALLPSLLALASKVLADSTIFELYADSDDSLIDSLPIGISDDTLVLKDDITPIKIQIDDNAQALVQNTNVYLSNDDSQLNIATSGSTYFYLYNGKFYYNDYNTFVACSDSDSDSYTIYVNDGIQKCSNQISLSLIPKSISGSTVDSFVPEVLTASSTNNQPVSTITGAVSTIYSSGYVVSTVTTTILVPVTSTYTSKGKDTLLVVTTYTETIETTSCITSIETSMIISTVSTELITHTSCLETECLVNVSSTYIAEVDESTTVPVSKTDTGFVFTLTATETETETETATQTGLIPSGTTTPASDGETSSGFIFNTVTGTLQTVVTSESSTTARRTGSASYIEIDGSYIFYPVNPTSTDLQAASTSASETQTGFALENFFENSGSHGIQKFSIMSALIGFSLMLI